MKLRKPYTTATIWPSGKITCAGAKSEPEAYKAARRYCRLLQKMQFKVKLSNYRVVNVLATCTMPFYMDIIKLADAYKKECSYEPELHPGATFKLKELKSTLKLFTTGSITLTSPSVEYAQRAIVYMFPILHQFKQSNGPSDMTFQQSSTINKVNPTSSIVNNTGHTNSSIQQYNTVYNQILSNGKSTTEYSIVNLTEKALITRIESSPAILQAQNTFHSQSHANQTPNQHNHLNHLYPHQNCSTESNFLDNSNVYPQENNLSRSSSSYINNFNYLNHHNHHQINHDDTNSYLNHVSATPSNASTSHWFNSYDNLLIDHHVDDLLP
jgi:TATA-box binding protein (TBP) (component of TFIID and TFIIIB)